MKEELIETKVDYRFISLEGSYYEVGFQLGNKLSEDKQLYPNILTDPFTPKKTGFASFKEMLDFIETYCPGIKEETQGLADGLNEPLERVAFSKYLIPNFKQSSCSQFFIHPSITEDGSIYLGRNYDYHPDDEDLILLRTKVKGSYSHIGFSLQGLGRAEGLNSKGLVISMTGGGAFDAPTTNYKSFNYCLAIRALLDNCKTVQSAVDMLLEMPIYSSTIYLIADNTGNAALVEGIDSKFAVKILNEDPSEQFIISTNHYNHSDLVSYNKYVNPWIWPSSHKRYSIIESKIKSFMPNITEDKALEILSKEIPDGVCALFFSEWFGTLWSILFEIKTGSADICFGPPTINPYYHFNMKNPRDDKDYVVVLTNKLSSDSSS
ncbi:MAG: C45 family autoproteolytic acyltransferase/hydrolase [Candidatus Hodarchaeota archaeon]